VQREIAAVTGDDASMAVLGVGADLAAFKRLLGSRLSVLEEEFVRPVDELAEAVRRAEQDLAALRQRQQQDLAARWGRYRAGYEQRLHAPTTPEALPEDELEAEDAGTEPPPARGFDPDPRADSSAPPAERAATEPATAEEGSE
jgi:hypothetical protein